MALSNPGWDSYYTAPVRLAYHLPTKTGLHQTNDICKKCFSRLYVVGVGGRIRRP